ncbi:hypothetical protein P7C73_g1448, partial [Tremellales sp. Uapishka_1]
MPPFNTPLKSLQPSQPSPTLAASPAMASGTNATSSSSTPTRRPPPPPQPSSSSNLKKPDPRDKDKTKPLFEWFSRKLGAGRRATVSNPETTPRGRPAPLPTPAAEPSEPSRQLSPTEIFAPTTYSNSISRTESHSLRSYSWSHRRSANNPYPSLAMPGRGEAESTPSMSFVTRSRSSSARSMGSTTSSPVLQDRARRSTFDGGSSTADEDASLRPIPPSRSISRSTSLSIYPPPRHSMMTTSSSPGKDDSMLNSEADVDKRSTTSTKPTTVLSFDSGSHIAHIAQPHPYPHPPSPLRPSGISAAREVVIQTGRDAVPSPPPSNPSTPATPSTPGAAPQTPPHTLSQAPKHSQPHPRDNPHPSASPDPNASMLTLASSTYGLVPGPARGVAISNRAPSILFAPASELGTSMRTYATGGWRADEDASVKAIRRRGSGGSGESGWSWRGAAGAGRGRGMGETGQEALAVAGLQNKESFWTAKSGLAMDENNGVVA